MEIDMEARLYFASSSSQASSVGLMATILERKGGAEQENAADHIYQQGKAIQ